MTRAYLEAVRKMQESMKLALVEENGIVGMRSVGSRLGKRADHARYWPAILISMIVVPMMVVLGFNAIAPAAAYTSPATVELGGAGNYVILAESAITATVGTFITGDIAISPAAATYIAGFDLILDATGVFSTSSLVSGHVFASDYASPTPSNLGTAIGNMETAYNDAAARTPADAVNLGSAGDITGLNLAPGLYNWTTGVQVSTGSVTFTGTASDIWILQINGDLTLASGTAVALVGAAASHIFWQVTGQVVLGTTSVMKGVILCKTQIVMNTDATLEGRALAQTQVTMQANAVAPPGTTPIPEFSQVLIPLVGMVLVVAIVSKVRNQRK
jgi:hypothetical protein